MEKHFEEVALFVQKAKNDALKLVNKALINLYWQVGEYISLKMQKAEWGEGVVTELADFLAQKHPDLKGFNARGLWRMKQFFETYNQNEKLSPLVTQIAWTNNLLIMSKTKSLEEKEFYLPMRACMCAMSASLQAPFTITKISPPLAIPRLTNIRSSMMPPAALSSRP